MSLILRGRLCLLIMVVVQLGSGSSVGSDADIPTLESSLDLARIYRVAQKVMVVLHKKCPALPDSYLVALVLVAFFEECEGCFFAPEALSELRKLVARDWKAV
jgi:hypothetical protein